MATPKKAEPPRQAPPQNVEAEESVLGAVLISEAAMEAVAELLAPGDFYRLSHAAIWQACLSLHERGQPTVAITVVDELERTGRLKDAGGRPRVHELAALVPATANAAHYAQIVRSESERRRVIQAGERITALGWQPPADRSLLIEEVEQVAFGLGRNREDADFAYPSETVPATFERIAWLAEHGTGVTGLPTGYHDLDRLTSGLHPGNLIVIAARPSMGKTALVLGILRHVTAHMGVPAALFTLEMDRQEVTQRLLSIEGLVEQQRVRDGTLRSPEEWNKLTTAASVIEKAPLAIHDSASVTVGEIRSKARRLKAREPNLGLIVVDYLQLLTAGMARDSRVQEVSVISRSLKVLAGELRVPVVALSQLSRAVEQRHDKRPMLSDLRESGSIEQDADLVWFIYRDDYYTEDTDLAGVAEVNIAKHRNGPTETVRLAFVKRFARFSDLAQPGDLGRAA